MKKYLVVAVILLFIGLAVAPSINANVSKERMIRIPVTEYKEDGTKEISIVKMSWSDLMVLKGKLQNEKDSEEILFFYKEYGLIPQDASLDKMREGMLRLAEKLNISKENLPTLGNRKTSIKQVKGREYKFASNYFSIVKIEGLVDFNIPIGLSFLIAPINKIIYSQDYDIFIPIPSVDLLQFHIFALGWLESKYGIMPDIDMYSLLGIRPLVYLLIGFVGFSIQTPILTFINMQLGFTIAIYAYGWVD